MAGKKILILGAGLAGLSAAWHLQRRGIDCQVFEKEKEVGGLCRSKNINGFIFDYDAHLLHFKHGYTFNLINRLLEGNLVEHNRSAWVYSNDNYTRYPFQANLYGLPPTIAKECLLGFIDASQNHKYRNKKNLTFLDWINQAFGEGIARNFMIPYNTKFWTLPPKRLTCEWLDGFVPVPSLKQLIEGTIQEGSEQFGYNARFWYPKKGGISEVALAFLRQLKNVYVNCKVTEIDFKKKEIRLNGANKQKFDYLIYTLPLPEAPYLINGLPQEIRTLFGKLKWNSIFNLNLGTDTNNISDKHWVYFPQKEISFFRIGFPHNFSSFVTPPNQSSVYAEVSYSKNRPIHKDKIIAQIKKDLKKVGVLKQGDKICCQHINDIEYGYPIYDQNYQKTATPILKHLRQNNIIPCGRYGSWRYMPMEDVILNGKKIAEFFIESD
jgi:UDP-galactopyranose mutase